MNTKTIQKKIQGKLTTRAIVNKSFEGLPKGMTGDLSSLLSSCVLFHPDDKEYPRFRLTKNKDFERFCIPDLNHYPNQ